jgi:Cell division protein 48 (CDC48), N-terminal domain.
MAKEQVPEVKLKVAEALQQDVGRGIARISGQYLEQIGVSPGEPVEIEGQRLTGAVAALAYQADAGLDIVRIDGLIRTNAGVSVGYRARIRNHGHSCFLCEIVIRSQFHTTYEPEA